MEIKEYREMQAEKLLKILGKIHFPDISITRNLKVIITAAKPFGDILIAIHSYNYGYMMGKRAERDVRKWNRIALFYNMQSYAIHHDGKLPKNLQELSNWMSRDREEY